jgi:hypothetical protein
MKADRSPLVRHTGAALLLSLASACSSNARDGERSPDAQPPPMVIDDEFEEATLEEGFLALWGAAADDVWAVGRNGVMAHYDGKRWLLSEPVTDYSLLAICGLSSSDIWVSGDDVILHYDGTAWTIDLQDMFEQLPGISCRGVDDIWAAGITTDVQNALLRHWNGEKWVVGLPGGVRSFWDVWSVGGAVWTGGSSSDGVGVLVKSDGGNAFDFVETYEGGSLRALWGTSDDDLWISPYEGPFEHWDGTNFVHEFGQSPVTILGMGGAATDRVWAAGLNGTILHFDGTSWGPQDSGVDSNLTNVWAAAEDDVWISGSAGILLHYDGKEWDRVPVYRSRGE